MEFTETSKILFGVITAIGTIAVTYFNLSQARKVKAELLEKFETAIEKSQKHSASELFRLIHGLRMSYSDIAALIENNDSLRIIYALKKTPGIVCYEDGEFRYSAVGKNKIYQFLDVWYLRISIALFSICLFVSLALLAFSEGVTSISGFVFTAFFSFMLAIQIKDKNYNKMVANLVNPEHSKAN